MLCCPTVHFLVMHVMDVHLVIDGNGFCGAGGSWNLVGSARSLCGRLAEARSSLPPREAVAKRVVLKGGDTAKLKETAA